jgi:hypothetical protein
MRLKQGIEGIARQVLHAIGMRVTVSTALMLFAVCPLVAQPYPSKPIKFILPLGAESPINAMARLAAPALSARVGPAGHRRKPTRRRGDDWYAGGRTGPARRVHPNIQQQQPRLGSADVEGSGL